jgi:hypothetical protein
MAIAGDAQPGRLLATQEFHENHLMTTWHNAAGPPEAPFAANR